MFATVNSDCIGCGACEAICPQVFRMNSYEIAGSNYFGMTLKPPANAEGSSHVCSMAALSRP